MSFKNKQDRKDFESFVRGHLGHILKCADLNHYRLYSLKSYSKAGEAMTIEPEPNYLDFDLRYEINWAADMWEEKDYDELISTLCHEVTHLPVGEIDLVPKIKKQNEVLDPLFERFVEHTSRWLRRCYDIYMADYGIDKATGNA